MHLGKNEFQKPACYVGNTVYMMMKILLDETKISDKGTYYLADYPWYSTKKWANDNSKNIKNQIESKLHHSGCSESLHLFGDILECYVKSCFTPLTSFRLK